MSAPPVFAYPPDWGQPVREKLGWRTDVIRALLGKVQTRELRATPRRGFAFPVKGGGVARQEAEAFLSAYSSVLLPIWHDAQRVGALASGATEILCATDGYDFDEGRYAVLWRSPADTEVVQVDEIQSDRITLVAPLASAWPAGARLIPGRVAHVAPARITVKSSAVAVSALEFEVDEPCDWPAELPATLYRDEPVLEHWGEESDDPSIEVTRLLQKLDNDTGPTYRVDLAERTWSTQDHAWKVRGRTANDGLRRLLYGLRGRAQRLWVPTQRSDLTLAAPVSAASTTITVKACGYSSHDPLANSRRDIRILLGDGNAYHRRITDADLSGDTEILTLDAALPDAIALHEVRAISFMEPMALDADTVEIVHVTDAEGLSKCAVRFEARDATLVEGQEVELYLFARGSVTWCLAGTQNPATAGWGFEYASNTYLPTAIAHNAIQTGGDAGRANTLTVTLPRTHDVASNWFPWPPADEIMLTIFRWKVGEPTADMVWSGRLVQPKWSDTTLSLTSEPVITITRGNAPAPRLQRSCWKTCYSDACGADPEAHRVTGTISAIDGFTITTDAAAAFPADRLVNGVLEWTRGDGLAMSRTIEIHNVGDSTIVIDYGDLSLTELLEISVLPGCRQSWDDCDTYFDNAVNCGALEYIPTRNPHDGNPVRD